MSERALILYFSGTGNTWLMADEIAKEFARRGVQSDLAALEQVPRNLDTAPYSIVGIGFPVYAWCFPSNMRRFLKRIPTAQGKRAFVFSTMQKSSWGSEALTARYLERKGYRVVSARAFLVVNNETIYYGPADPCDPWTSKMIENMKAQAPFFVSEILSGKGEIERNNALQVLASQLTGVGFDLLDGYLASRNFRILENCTRCGLCERICPEANIYESLTTPRFRNRCLMCERCVNFCPEKAIVHPLRRIPYTDIRYQAAGYRPPRLRRPTKKALEPNVDVVPELVTENE
ncbi:EFR1 family ferrodoxin [candidate division WOR-3 bacterium]|nr:EFR1 family ferrodoxin [candidate division WOR-3 bacterium]